MNEVILLDKQLENTKHRKRTLKQDYRELQGKMGRHLGDPEAVDKLKLGHEYLDKMIKGEYIQIKSLNDKNDKFVRHDFI